MASTDEIRQHIRDFSLNIDENVPEHEPRDEYNDDFYQQERQAVIEAASGCYVCGRTEDDLGQGDGYGQYLETHHWGVEWSLWNAVDTDKIQELFDSCSFDPYGFCKEMKGSSVNHPGDRRNLLVLCPRHHRYSPDPGKGGGIHNVPMPLWIFQKIKKGSYDLFKKD